MINPAIFREYDIRGLAATDLNDENVAQIARAFGTYFRQHDQHKVVVGFDARSSSPRITELVIAGLRVTGCDVTKIGMVPTPVLYFALFHLDIPNGIMVTASHNPKEFNGFKVCRNRTAVYGQEIQQIGSIAAAGKWASGNGLLSSRDIIPDYVEYLTHHTQVNRGMRLVVDTGNGTCGPVMEMLAQRLGLDCTILFREPDGDFPNHLPDPTVEKYIQALIASVRNQGFPCGIGLDGDGDRIGVVDETGRMIWGDMLLAIYAEDVLKAQPGATIIFEVKCSKALVERITQLGGKPLMYRTGHSLIKAKMKEVHSPLAGEMSGHIFFADRYFGYDDAIYAALRILEILGRGEPLSRLRARIPTYFTTPEIRVDTADDKKFAIVKQLTAVFKERYPVNDIDGARVDFGDGWGLVRASNTQPVLVLRFEAATEARLNEIQSLFTRELDKLT